MRGFAIALTIISVAIVACTHADSPVSKSTPSVSATMDQAMLINEMTPPYSGTASDAKANQEAHERLSQELVVYLKDEYRIADSLFFQVDRKNFEWVSVWKQFSNKIETPHGACLERQEWNRPGYDLIAVWRVPSAPYTRIVLAALNDESAEFGPRLVGYFQLERIESLRNEAALVEEQKPCERRGFGG